MMTEKLTLSIFSLLAIVPMAAQAQDFECAEVKIPMRDGVELAADVYRPLRHGPGPFPVVIERTPYDKGNCDDVHSRFFAKRGYVAIRQDERGRYASEGEYYWLRDEGWGERRDGYDTIEWAASQPWSTGKVGTMGLSFTCLNQYLTAPTRPPHLAAMFCAHSASNAYRDLYYAGGALHMIMPTWLLTMNEMVKPLKENMPANDGYVGDQTAWRGWYDLQLETGSTMKESLFSEMMNDMLENPYYDDYWRQFAIDERWSEIDVPIFHYASWYDRYPHSQVKHYNGIRRLTGEGRAKALHWSLAPRRWRSDRSDHRRPGLRAGGLHRLRQLEAPLVRLPPQGHRQRHHERAAGPDLRHGREPMAGRIGVPAVPGGRDGLLLAPGDVRLDRLPKRRPSSERSSEG